jgi:hypothetical protein
MKKMSMVFVLGLGLSVGGLAYGAVSHFEDLALGPGSYWNGSTGSGGFQGGKAWFYNHYDATWDSWEGFAYSNMTDKTTPGWGNQYSAIAGSGAAGSNTYAVGFQGYTSGPPTLSLLPDPNLPRVLAGAYFTNTTYAYLAMKNGEMWAKKFGGADGDDPDWFKLTITGFRSDFTVTPNAVEFYLADYRFSDNDQDYIVSDWTWVGLGALGEIVGLRFELSSSDIGPWGMNTPAYFAMDDLTPVPIPGAIWLLGSGLLALAALGRGRATGGGAS